MHDDLGRKRIDRPIEGRAILQHRLDRPKTGVLEEILVAPALELGVVIVGHPIVADDLEAFVQKMLRQMIADEARRPGNEDLATHARRSEEHTSELQSLMRISYAVFCLKKKTQQIQPLHTYT